MRARMSFRKVLAMGVLLAAPGCAASRGAATGAGAAGSAGAAATSKLLTAAGSTATAAGAAATGARGAVAGASPATVGVAPAPGPIDRTLEMRGIRFHVTSSNEGSTPKLTVAPSGLSKDSRPVTREVDGTIVGTEVADLDGNGWPEVYVFMTSVGSGSYGSVVGYAVNEGKSMSEVFLNELDSASPAGRGYMGHDEFHVAGNRLVRTFPVYRERDPNCCPTGGRRTIEYDIVPGEAAWILRPVKTTERP